MESFRSQWDEIACVVKPLIFAHEHETKQLWQSERTGPQRVSCSPVRLRERIVNGVFRAQ